ncbi:MAG: TlpA family protein disulfide reductase [Anaerolineae bacterium]
MDGLEADWGDEVRVVRLNVHEDGVTPLLQQLNFRFTPTFILFDGNGREAWRTVGGVDPAIVKKEVARLP